MHKNACKKIHLNYCESKVIKRINVTLFGKNIQRVKNKNSESILFDFQIFYKLLKK